MWCMYLHQCFIFPFSGKTNCLILCLYGLFFSDIDITKISLFKGLSGFYTLMTWSILNLPAFWPVGFYSIRFSLIFLFFCFLYLILLIGLDHCQDVFHSDKHYHRCQDRNLFCYYNNLYFVWHVFHSRWCAEWLVTFKTVQNS